MTRALAALQARFLEAVLDDGPVEGVAPPGAIDVYRRNALASFHAALAAAYPVVRRLVGEAFFAEAARRYARAFASTSGDLHGYGETFASFLGTDAAAKPLDYLADVARLEWAVHESFHEAEAPAFDFAALARVPAERHGGLRLRLAPHVRLVASPHPVLAIWEANQPERDGAPDRFEGPDHVVVRREGFGVVPQAIDATAWNFLRSLGDGASLATASEALGVQEESRLPALLSHWIGAGVIAGFEASRE